MNKVVLIIFLLLACWCHMNAQSVYLSKDSGEQKTLTLSKKRLKDKIKGGWAGQVIGVTYGSVTEFKYKGTFIQDYQPIEWYNGYIKAQFESWPDLYDDIYMDLTFVEVIERCGVDVPVDSFAIAFARAGYVLWHANQAARYNILNGISPLQSGHWHNNPHADDIDFQIEADFAGLMHPGMPNAAANFVDPIGHIMNYGDGWYGGVYVCALYTLAFVTDDIPFIIREALKTIPAQSTFYKCINDVINWHHKYPNDWKQTWFELQKKWSSDIGCPEGVFDAFNIDAKLNMAYVVLALLYGKSDFGKTLEIATRCGQDSDCNPGTAGGILGTIKGYSNIPEYWKMGLSDIEDRPFKHTSLSLNAAYDISYKHAIEMIKRHGGEVSNSSVTILLQKPTSVRFEQSFEGLVPKKKIGVDRIGDSIIAFEFEGTGFALRGESIKKEPHSADYVFDAILYLDDQIMERAKFYTNFLTRRYELFWKYGLENKKHMVKIIITNPSPYYEIKPWDCIIYGK
ncbi:hypothetical protein PIECOFPK_01776 [Mycovorax composti]|uniref:ADP-ribosylglycohydrolase family protein n=2 Tax=Chitinophagaceae TaxID=563835 RepID=A0ABZ2EKL7_9BACT